MRYKEISEDANADIQTRTFIQNVAHKIMQALYSGARPRKLEYGKETVFMFSPEALDVGTLMPHVFFIFTLQDQAIMTASVRNYNTPVWGKYDRVMVLHCLKELSNDDLRRVGQSTDFFATIKHELTHSFDFDRTNSKVASQQLPTEGDPNFNSGYYNDPAEYNAYFHDFASNLTEVGKELIHCQTRADAMEILDLYGLDGNFKHDLWALRTTPSIPVRAFLKWINEKNQKKLLRRLYLIHTEIMKRVNALH